MDFSYSCLIYRYLILFFIIFFSYNVAFRLIGFQEFKVEMGNQVFSYRLNIGLAYLILAYQGLCCVLLLYTKTAKVGFGCICIFLFLVIIYISLVLGKFFGNVPCSCAGLSRNLSWNQHLLITILLFLISVFCFYYSNKRH